MSKLPKTQLETFIILPVQVVKTDQRGNAIEWHSKEFHQTLLRSGSWEKLDGHELDQISIGTLAEDDLKNIRYQSYNYFHPFVRTFWFDKNLVQRFRRTDIATLKVTIIGSETEFNAVCDLLHFTPDIALFVLHLKSCEALDFQLAQNCLDRVRRIYPPFIGQDRSGKLFGGHFPDVVELLNASKETITKFDLTQLISLRNDAKKLEADAGKESSHKHVWAKHWQHLIEPLNGPNSAFRARQLGDDRAGLASLVTIDNPRDAPLQPNSIDRGNQIRLCFADGSGSDRTPYSERYLNDFEKRFCYDRFWHLDGESSDYPSRIMNCGYAFTWMGDSRDLDYFCNPSDGAPVTFRHIYAPMAIIAHFHKASLLVTARKLADLSPFDADGKPEKLDAKKFQTLKANFIAFTQTYWFDEITPQEQGIELFEIWRRELRLQSLHDEMRREIQEIVELIETNAASNLNRLLLFFGGVGVALTLASVVLAALSLPSISDLKNHLGEFERWAVDTAKYFFTLLH